MPATTVIFKQRSDWGTVSNYKDWLPYCWIRLHSPVGKGHKDLWGLLDTGTQFLVLPHHQASFFGINLETCPTRYVQNASGNAVEMSVADVDVTIRGKRISVKTLFGPIETVLIGIDPIVFTMVFGANEDGWLYRELKVSLRQQCSRFLKSILALLLKKP